MEYLGLPVRLHGRLGELLFDFLSKQPGLICLAFVFINITDRKLVAFGNAKDMLQVNALSYPIRPASAPRICMSVLQTRFHEYLALSDSFLTASIEQGSTDMLPVVRISYSRVAYTYVGEAYFGSCL